MDSLMTPPNSPGNTPQDAFARLRHYLEQQVLGQPVLVERLLVALLADGHLLVEGPPGLAKTRAVKALAHGRGVRLPARAVHARHAAGRSDRLRHLPA
ncbi:MAG: hypothetical protein V9G29_05235 [Burkholderiaceae bacterium]